jgi:hypothetical protein
MDFSRVTLEEYESEFARLIRHEIHHLLVERLPEEHYHASTGLSFHQLDPIIESALECQYRLNTPLEPTLPMCAGSAIHELLADGKLTTFTLCENGEKRSIKDRRIKREDIEGILEAYYTHPAVRSIVLTDDLMTEISVFWWDGDLLRRARIDYYSPSRKLLGDHKTTSTFDERTLSWKLTDGYLRQLAYYREALLAAGFEVDHALISWIKTTKAIDVALWRMPDSDLAKAHEQNQWNLARFKECQRSGSWPGKYPSVIEIGSPVSRSQSNGRAESTDEPAEAMGTGVDA